MIFNDNLDDKTKSSLQSDIDLIFQALPDEHKKYLKEHYFSKNKNNHYYNQVKTKQEDESNPDTISFILEQSIANLSLKPQFLNSLIQNTKLTNDEKSYLNKQSQSTKIKTTPKKKSRSHNNKKTTQTLTKEEQYALAVRIQAGDEEARDEMILANLPLVFYFANRFKEKGVDFEDLVSEGVFGLVKGVEAFDPRKGYKFSSYAQFWIKRDMQRAIYNQSQTIRKSDKFHVELNKYIKARITLREKFQREPSIEEIAQFMNVKAETVLEIVKIDKYTNNIRSVDMPLKEYEDIPLSETLDNQDDLSLEEKVVKKITETENRSLFKFLLDDCLSERDANIIKMRYGLEGSKTYTLTEIGQKFQTTRQNINQIEKRILLKLREKLKEMNLSYE